MADKKIVSVSPGLVKGFASEDGLHYRTMSQDIDPIIDRVKYLDQKVNEAPRSTNRNGYTYIGSIPMSMLIDWLAKRGYTMHDWATNAGGEKGKVNPTGPGVKDQFMRWFQSRDFNKLHTRSTHARLDVRTPSKEIYTGD